MANVLHRRKAFRGGFTPLSDPLALNWWDTADLGTITAIGNDLSQIDDKIGSDNLTNAGTGNPQTGTETLNGKNVIDFDGDQWLEKASYSGVGTFSLHGVWIVDSLDGAANSIISADATNDWQVDSNNATQFDGRTAPTGMGSSYAWTGGPYSSAFLLSILFDFSGETIETFVNNVSVGSTSDYTGVISPSLTLRMMTNRSTIQSLNGKWCGTVFTESIANRDKYTEFYSNQFDLGL